MQQRAERDSSWMIENMYIYIYFLFLFNSRDIFNRGIFNTSSSLPVRVISYTTKFRKEIVVRNSAGMQCSTRRLFTDTEMCTHAVVSQRSEINKDKREQRGESAGRDNVRSCTWVYNERLRFV